MKATATVDGKDVVRYGTLDGRGEGERSAGCRTRRRSCSTSCAVAVVEKPPFALKLTADPASIEKGKAGKMLVEATRGKAADGDIALAPLFVPPNVTPAVEADREGADEGRVGVTVRPGRGRSARRRSCSARRRRSAARTTPSPRRRS